jgi:hypothetical protein
VLQDAFQEVLFGRNKRYLDWLDIVEVPQNAHTAAGAGAEPANA